eukprot:9238107-Heterocapsa_arctica.AAC.1
MRLRDQGASPCFSLSLEEIKLHVPPELLASGPDVLVRVALRGDDDLRMVLLRACWVWVPLS